MDLRIYVDNIHQQLAAAAEAGGDDARALAERLAAPLDAALRLTLQDALAAAAEEITTELAPGSVELRLRGRNPEFVVTLPPAETQAGEPLAASRDSLPNDPFVAAAPPPGIDEGAVSRINLRMPDQLKSLVEQAAAREGLSVNSWLVRAAAAALDRAGPSRQAAPRAPQGGQRFTGWAR
jgi:hypothetical protein